MEGKEDGMGIVILVPTGMLSNKEAIEQALSPFGARDNGVIGSECGACTFGWGCVCDPALGLDN